MKRLVFLLCGLSLMAVSCGPSSFLMDVEMRDVSRSGLDLGRKTFSVVYIDNGDFADSTFSASAADGFAQTLESGYFSGERVINVYRLDSIPGADYSSRDTLVNILMDVGTDVVFLIEPPELGRPRVLEPVKVRTGGAVPADSSYLSEVEVPFLVRLDVYDSMNKADSVFSFTGKSTVRPVAYSDGNDPDDIIAMKAARAIGEPAATVGRKLADSFLSTWKNESYSVIYYDSGRWLDAAYAASDYRWKDAMDIWMGLLDTGNLQKRSCAEYNISLACYMLGNYALALEWLDRSDSDCPLYQSRSLRQKISSRIK